ncbi:MAG: hypothetical protein JKX67_01610 [Colwellia sp.]|nr:hypothetical protein [Colwellia sp.]
MKNIIFTITTSFFLLLSGCASTYSTSNFRGNNWHDAMTDTSTTEQRVYFGADKYLGFRCDVSPTQKEFFLTFGSGDAIATPNNSNVKLKIRVDSGKVYEVKGRMYSNSYRSGTIKDFPKELLTEIKSGTRLLVNIYSYKELKERVFFFLTGSEVISEVQKACGITSNATKLVGHDEKEFEMEKAKILKD